ncbi:ATP-binding cassette domain-containing protein [Candidatus Saccharibacteria bacterium oral taxon 488]|nr:ATP-binding cassette domain-containing protein [Candidatus Saccharibacteria bacterium oral taxon 488]
MNDPSTRIKLTNVTKRFGFGDAEQVALDNVNLEVKKGEFIAIVGPSGCGKTTLLNILGLLDHPSEGEYYLDNKPVEDLTATHHATIRSRDIGFIFQHFNLIPRLTVIDNVALPLTYKGISKTKRLQEASRILRNFHLGEREYYLPHQLSGGQVQRVAIARALVNSPSIILADEPTGNLDSKSSHIIMEELSDIHRRGNTIIMVTHNPELLSYASRVISMLDGRIDTDTHHIKKIFKQKLGGDDQPATPVSSTPTHTATTKAEKEEKAEPAKTAPEKPTTKEAATATTPDKPASPVKSPDDLPPKRPLGATLAKITTKTVKADSSHGKKSVDSDAAKTAAPSTEKKPTPKSDKADDAKTDAAKSTKKPVKKERKATKKS